MIQIIRLLSSETAIRLKSPNFVLHFTIVFAWHLFHPHTLDRWCERRVRMSTGERKPLWCGKKTLTNQMCVSHEIWRLPRSGLMAFGRREPNPAGSSLALAHSSVISENFAGEKIWKCFSPLFMTICRVNHQFFIRAFIAKKRTTSTCFGDRKWRISPCGKIHHTDVT